MTALQKADPESLVRAALSRAISDHRGSLDALMDRVAPDFIAAVERLRRCLAEGGKILLCGNGGSAADAQHFAAEMIGRTNPWPAIALTVDTSALTALANDYGYPTVFSRQLRGLGRPGDVLVAISTSGRSRSILDAVTAARELRVGTIGLTGADGQQLGAICDICLTVPATRVSRIQELHILLLHAMWEALEACQ